MTGRDLPPAGGSFPAQLSSFVGRRSELAEIKRLTSEFRLVTLCGVGGVGKTRLAQRAAAQALRAFPDGAVFVDLTALGRPDPPTAPQGPGFSMPSIGPGIGGGTAGPGIGGGTALDVLAGLIATAVGLREGSPGPPVRALCDHLAPRCLLLVLDNCEHLLVACAALVHELLHAGPDLRIVATSREPLGLIGEVTYPVLPLRTADPAAPAGAPGAESMTLFAARAVAVQPGFRLTDGNRGAVADICRRLDGVPLAIEMAAARLRVLTPAQISARLADRFALLGRGSRNAPERQQSLRGCVDWSYRLCGDPERRLWARLSVFAGSFELDAIEGICAGDELVATELLDLTAALIDKSVLSRYDHGRVVRYRMLETIRAYGQDRLLASGEQAALRRRHRDWYESLAERANTEWVGDRQGYWLDRLKQEHANLRAAVDFCLAEPGDAERALHISVCLPDLCWWGPQLFREGRRWLDRALDRSVAPTVLRAQALLLAGRLAFAQGDLDAGGRLLAEGEELARRLDDAAALSLAAFLRGAVALFANDVPVAVENLERALTVLDRAPRPEWDHRLRVLLTLLAAAGLAGDVHRATTCYEAALAITEPRREGLHHSIAMWAFGLAAWRQGDLQAAVVQQVASLRLKHERGLDDPVGTALCLEALAWAESGAQPRRAAVLLGAADARWAEHGTSIGSYRHLAGGREGCERQIRRALDASGYQQAYRDGRGLTGADALAYALQERRPAVAPPEPAGPTPLTRREQQVAALVAGGLSNRDIAHKLVIAQRTAESHVANILVKQGFSSRAQIAAWIAEQATQPPGRPS